MTSSFSRFLAVFALLTGISVQSPAAAGTPVTFSFQGAVQNVFDNDNVFNDDIQSGTQFLGRYTFDSTTHDQNPANPLRGIYPFSQWSLQVGTQQFFPTFLGLDEIIIYAGTPGNALDTYLVGAGWFGGLWQFYVDGYGLLGNSDALPTTPPDLNAARTTNFAINAGASSYLQGRLDSIALVPEPSTMVLWLAALGVAAASRFRRIGSHGEKAR